MRVSRLRGAVLVTGAALALSGVAAPAYSVTYTYSPLPQAEMTAVYTDSVEQTGEGTTVRSTVFSTAKRRRIGIPSGRGRTTLKLLFHTSS